ncbi:hypothetical protein PLANTIT3_61476 [Plantibacter sp. T3]|nr:hypothetical protein PLANTIT3_61476 [Plantibacter sp. T3]
MILSRSLSNLFRSLSNLSRSLSNLFRSLSLSKGTRVTSGSGDPFPVPE